MKDLIEPNASVVYDRVHNCLSVSFSGFIPYERMMKIFQHEFEMIRHYRLSECMIDLRDIQVYAPGVTDYIRDTWFAQVRKDGIKHIAFIVPQSVFGATSMNKAHQGVQNIQEIKVNHFQDMPAAQQWLSEVTQLDKV